MTKIIRLKIGGNWSAADFSTCIHHLNRLYQCHMVMDMAYHDYREMEEYLYDFPFPSRIRKYRAGQLRQFGLISPNVVELMLSEKDRLEQLLSPTETLTVSRVRYASPGIIDLAGIGKSIDALLNFIKFLIEYCGNHNLRKIERELKSEELKEKRIENARMMISTLKELGHSETEIRQMITLVDESQGVLIELIANDKIRGVHIDPKTKN